VGKKLTCFVKVGDKKRKELGGGAGGLVQCPGAAKREKTKHPSNISNRLETSYPKETGKRGTKRGQGKLFGKNRGGEPRQQPKVINGKEKNLGTQHKKKGGLHGCTY